MVFYLDIFHAVKRFGKKIPKCHPLRRQCISEWRMVFRDQSDHGETRHSSTPTPLIMESNLDIFLHRWKDSEYDGRKVLSAAAKKEICVHVRKGCFSGIQPGRGTNRNENFKDLKKIVLFKVWG